MSPRAALTAIFALAGFAHASWAVRIPDISAQVGADHETLGTALLCLSLGALATMRLTGALVDRLGAGLATGLGSVLLCVALTPPGLTHSVYALTATLMALGAASGVVNVAMNSLGVRLEAETGRPILPSLHAAFSFGGLGGGLVGGLLSTFAGPAAHLMSIAGAGLLVTAALAPSLIAADPRLHRVPPLRWRPRVLVAGSPSVAPKRAPAAHEAPIPSGIGLIVALGVVAGCTAYGEGALSDWAALHLSSDLGASDLVAAIGYAAFSLAMACARLAGHTLLRVLGERRLLVSGTLLASVGMLAAARSADVATTLVGLVVVGLGLANVFPIAMARAGALGGARGVGVASTVGYGGLLLGPALIGYIAAHAGLPDALTTVSAAAATAALIAARVTEARPTRQPVLVLPGSHAEALARARASLLPIGSAIHVAAKQHANGLLILWPPAPEAGTQLRPIGSHPTTHLDFEAMLGRRGSKVDPDTGTTAPWRPKGSAAPSRQARPGPSPRRDAAACSPSISSSQLAERNENTDGT